MRIISTCLMLLLSGFAFSQFNRTFLHANWTSNIAFSNYSYYDLQNKVNLVTARHSSAGETTIITQRISSQGDVETFDKQTYSVTLPVNAQHSMLLTAVEQGSVRYIALGVGGANSMKLVWLKLNKNTGALISTTTSANDYKTSYFEPKLVGNELVTYVVKSTGGLVRVGLDINTFTAPTEELVSASITATASFNNTSVSGFKSGNLFVVNGQEKVICGAGVSNTTIFTRTAPNTYTSVLTGIGTTRSVSSFLMDATTIGVTDGVTIQHFNAAGTMVHNGFLTWYANSIASQIEFFQNQYHIYYKQAGSNKGIFLKENQAFQIVDSTSTNVMLYHISKSQNGLLLVGSDVEKGLNIDLEEQPEMGRTVYCEAYTQFPVLKYDEYMTELISGNLKTHVGLGTKVIAGPYGLPGATYQGVSAAFNLTEHFVGFFGSDVISNSESTYTEQYNELPGPHTTNSMYNELLESKYNRPYHVSREMIQEHINAVQSNTPNYIPRWEIRNWPAHGDPALGQAADLAPFADLNSNGTYEPQLGEYPSIFGDDCVFSITHYRTADNSKALEFHSYVYTQSCDTSDAFDHVLMRKVQVHSRGAEVDSLFFGGRFDGDLGNFNDDYVGAHVDLGLLYNYNADLFDEPGSGRPGYNDTLAAQGIMILKGIKLADDGLDNGIGILPGESVNGYGFNDGITDNEYQGLLVGNMYTGGNAPVNMSDPANATEWYNMLNGYFRFGDTIFYGGTGFQSGTIPSKFMYSGNEDTYHYGTGGVDPGFGWYEFEPQGTGSTPNPPGDRRCGYSFGKTALSSGEFIELDYAYLIKRQPAPLTSLFEPVTDLFAKASVVRNAFLGNEGPCGINFNPVPVDLGIDESTNVDPFTLYPNPTAGLIRINGISEAGGIIQVFDINGKLLQTVTDYQAMQEIDLSRLDGSLFIIRISSDSKTAQKRVVKY